MWRFVEAERGANPGDLLGSRGVAGKHLRRIARRQVEQAEHDQGHDAHHGHGQQQTPNDVAQHL